MSFQRLAVVEVQLVMQMCDLQSLLALAQCSRATLAAASHPFVWRGLPPLLVSSSELERVAPAALSASLLRFCDVALRCPPRVPRWLIGAAADSQTEDTLRLIESIPRLRALDVLRFKGLRLDHWRRMLAHPALRTLTALRVGAGDRHDDGGVGGALIPLLAAHCSQLQRLHLHAADPLLPAAPESPDPSASQPPSPPLPHLTDLLLQMLAPALPGPLDLSWCPSLRRLHLTSMTDNTACAVLCSASLMRLEVLVLHCVGDDFPEPDEEADWAGCFANLRALHSLRLYHCRAEGLLLAALLTMDPQRLPLRSLHLRPWEEDLPQPLLSRLLDHLPCLSVRLELSNGPPAMYGPDGVAVDAATREIAWRRVLEPWESLQRERPGRFALGELPMSYCKFDFSAGAWLLPDRADGQA